ncbi:MAG: DoxX family protein [Bacteroidota bacterium]
MKNILFSKRPIATDLSLLILRLIAGIGIMTHGWPKFQKAISGNFQFADPIGLGSELSLILVVFAEFICGILVVLGLGTRFAAIILIINMSIIFFIVHAADAFGSKEKAFLFLGAFIVLLLTGPGKYSIDDKI